MPMQVTELRLGEVLVVSADADGLSGPERRNALDVLSAGDRVRLRTMRDARADAFLTGRLLAQLGLARITTAPSIQTAPRPAIPLAPPPLLTSPSDLEMGFALQDGIQATPKLGTHPESGEPELGVPLGDGSPRAGTRVTTLRVLCAHCGSSDHGKPGFAGLPVLVSIAYAGPAVFVALASADRHSALGVDAEELKSDAAAEAARGSAPEGGACVTADPASSLERWTAVEAVLKADGRGLRVDPSGVAFGPDDLARVGGDRYRLRRAVVDEGFLVTVATRA